MTQSDQPLLVMVVDDEDDVRDEIADIIRTFGPERIKRPIEIRTAAGKADVLGHLRAEWVPDVVFLDNNLQGKGKNDGTGMKLVAPLFITLQETGRLTKGVAVVMVTSGDLAAEGEARFARLERHVAASLNIVDLVRKPFGIRQVTDALANALTGM